MSYHPHTVCRPSRDAGIARAHNRAVDRGDHFTAGLIADYANLSCRDLDRTIGEMTDAEIVALVTPSPSASPVVNAEQGEMRRPLGRELSNG